MRQPDSTRPSSSPPPGTPAHGQGKDITALEYAQRFVSALPADSAEGAHVRTVLGACYSGVQPDRVQDPKLLVLVPEVCELLDLSPRETPELVEVLAGNRVLPGMAPYAACYGGHQFGSWAGQLGDGRAITLGEVKNRRGELWEVQLKGAGRTPYSRRGDGRAVLRSSLRELVCSEAMHHLGVPTTRALSLVTSGDGVVRDLLYDGRPRREPGAITCRVAPSFLRFGNYEIFAARKDQSTLEALMKFTLETFFPELPPGEPESIVKFFELVCVRTARLISEWMRVGFVHGVMNTDNMSILGLTIDYGPYGWIDDYDPDWTPNTTDATRKRYRFGQQPNVAWWNLTRLASALSPLFADIAPLQAGLDRYVAAWEAADRANVAAKLGLTRASDEDLALRDGLHAWMRAAQADMTLAWRALADFRPDAPSPDLLAGVCYDENSRLAAEPALRDWLERYAARLREDPLPDAQRRARMRAANPRYVLRNYLAQEAIDRAEQGDYALVHELLDVMRHPYDEQPGRERFAHKRPDWAKQRAGCSMLSCSS